MYFLKDYDINMYKVSIRILRYMGYDYYRSEF